MSSDARPTSGAMLRMMRAIDAYWLSQRVAPTYQDLCRSLGLSSTNGIAETVKRLERRGLVTRTFGSPRTLRLTEAGSMEIGT